MQYLVGAYTLLKALPDLIKLGKEIIAFLHQVSDYVERWQKTKEFREAVKVARETGDTSGIDRLFNGGISNAPLDVSQPKP